MKFNKENSTNYNVMELEETGKCSVCNGDTKYVDYCCDNKFCSTECQEKYYEWLKRNEEKAIC